MIQIDIMTTFNNTFYTAECNTTLRNGLQQQIESLYTDFNVFSRRSIFRTDLESGDTNLFLKTENDIIDGMVLADGKIYWTDFFEGEIAFADISSDPVTRVLLVGGLKKPRALFVKDK